MKSVAAAEASAHGPPVTGKRCWGTNARVPAEAAPAALSSQRGHEQQRDCEEPHTKRVPLNAGIRRNLKSASIIDEQAPHRHRGSPALRKVCDLQNMRADRVEVSWNADKHKWVVRIEVGSEVIRRLSDVPREASEEKLRNAAVQTIADEGYEVDLSHIVVIRQ